MARKTKADIDAEKRTDAIAARLYDEIVADPDCQEDLLRALAWWLSRDVSQATTQNFIEKITSASLRAWQRAKQALETVGEGTR